MVWQTGNRFFDGLDTMFNPPQPTPVVDVRSVVVQEVRGASELTTAIWGGNAVIPASKVRTLLGFQVAETRLLYLAVGDVRAGVDLSEITQDDVQVISDTIRITLPPPRLLDYKVDVSRSSVYDYDRGWLGLGPEGQELQSLAEQAGLQALITSACQFGILELANEKAQVAVSQLLNLSGYRQVIVETQSAPPEACPTE